MVSGVGPKEELSKYDIPVLADRPGVGKGMWVCDLPFPRHHNQKKMRLSFLLGSYALPDYLSGRCSYSRPVN